MPAFAVLGMLWALIRPPSGLDPLRYLEGCWAMDSHVGTFRSCWTRQADRWVGYIEAPTRWGQRRTRFEIVEHLGVLVLLTGDDRVPVELSEVGPDTVVFGRRPQQRGPVLRVQHVRDPERLWILTYDVGFDFDRAH